MKKFGDLIGHTIKKIEGMVDGSESVSIFLENGDRVEMYHAQSCCEDVRLYDVNGDPQDLIGSSITLAQESFNGEEDEMHNKTLDSYTWTFYKLATEKGFVDMRWIGGSNGCYSESVDLNWKEKK